MSEPTVTVVCTFPNGDAMMPVSFTLHERYGIYSASEAHEWFLRQLSDHETFEVWEDEFADMPDECPLEFDRAGIRSVVSACG